MLGRRDLLCGAALAPQALLASDARIVIDPTPRFPLSPYLYMQFMEPLGVTDSSVEAAWDHGAGEWRRDFVATVKDLAPGAMRWGGILSRYYKWREGVGPVEKRPPMRNYQWGGWETNRVGTHEFVSLCRETGAEPLYCVNFLGDGVRKYAQTPEGNRTGDAEEAAAWVSYCNDPDNRERKAHGFREPYGVKLWQIGNETSYGRETFTKDQAIAHTLEFARAMKKRDASIRLIGWGDRGPGGELWAPDLLRRAGADLDFVAIHMMGQHPTRPDSVLRGLLYQKEPERAWEELLALSRNIETRLSELEQVIASSGSPARVAVTEGHLSLAPHNANPILTEWLTGVYHARSMNIYQRHGERVAIATCADFEGSRWTVTAVMLQVPSGVSYLTPAGSVMRLFKRYNGDHAVNITAAPSSLDIAASRGANRVFLHVANLEFRNSVQTTISVAGAVVTGGRVRAIAPHDIRQSVDQDHPDVFRPVLTELPGGPDPSWSFPPASVSVVELDLK